MPGKKLTREQEQEEIRKWEQAGKIKKLDPLTEEEFAERLKLLKLSRAKKRGRQPQSESGGGTSPSSSGDSTRTPSG